MTMFERWSLAAAFAAIFINVVAFVAVIWQLRLLAYQNQQAQQAVIQDHDRRRKQATLEFYASTHEKQIDYRKILPNAWDGQEISKVVRKAMDGDLETQQFLAGYFSLHEHLAAGVRAGVFDLNVINQCAGGRMVVMAKYYGPWMLYQRRLLGVADLWFEFEWLAEQLIELRRSMGMLCADLPAFGEDVPETADVD